ncbi:DUF6298 domain-containing protein [Crateriforma conspicua]|uniref:Collagen-binding domain-containing protein n=1 Tax=Crateriforma conspicua TaxID=2527996 RepID=A0A5C6FQG3_9PLAN|nr:DUF6298 domain-containing protein [Crateriforma conspicua]TWU62713.1 hypothetical protein V7x_44490 [Crateriforma conspicua]
MTTNWYHWATATALVSRRLVCAGGLSLAFSAAVCPATGAQESRTDQRGIEPWDDNRWYWSYRGEPVLLLGGSDDDNLFQWPADELKAQLDRIQAAGGNVVRNTMSDRPDRGTEVYPFLRLDNGKYDLSRWNPEYWERFERFLRWTAQRDIFVQIEIWDRFDYADLAGRGPRRWIDHPYNPANNVNYTFDESGFAKTYPDHPGQNKQPFFFTTPRQRDNQVVLKYQQRQVAKLLQHSLQYDHVLYCIDNETRAQPQWGQYWAEFIKQHAKDAGCTVMVTEMWDDWNLSATSHRETFDHPEIYDYVDVSQNNHNSGEKHWQNFLFVRDYLKSQPRPMNTTKTYGADGNKFGHRDQDAIERFWRHLLAGAASIRFHRPDSGIGINDKAVTCLRAARDVERLVPLWDVNPMNDLLIGRQANEAYAAAGMDGQTLVIFFPANATTAEVAVRDTGQRTADWISIDTDQRIQTRMGNKELMRLRPPSGGNWALVLRGEVHAER